MPINGPHIIPLVHSKVQFFPDTTRIWQALTRVNRKDSTTKLMVIKIFDMIDGVTSVGDLLIAENLLMDISYDQQPKVFIVNEGEDFCLEIALDVDADFTNYFLTARDESLNLLSADDIVGDSYANAPIQTIELTDLALSVGGFYKCVALLEHPDGPITSGNAASKLTDFILIVESTIDAV